MSAVEEIAKILSPSIFEAGRQGGWVRRERKAVREKAIKIAAMLAHYDQADVNPQSEIIRTAGWEIMNEVVGQDINA